MKEVRIASCTFVFSWLFTLCECNLFGGKEVWAPMRGKVTVEKALKRAGAAFIRPKSSWGRSRPFLICCGRVLLANRDDGDRTLRQVA